MKKLNSISLDDYCRKIIEKMPLNLNNDQKMRYLYREICKVLSKSTKFFYDRNETVQNEMYNDYTTIENYEVICKSVVHLISNLAKEVGLDCIPIEMDTNEGLKYNHWALEYRNNNKHYLINPIPDFYRVQMGFSTKHFCNSEDYYGYEGIPFDVMEDDYLRELDASLGYLSSGFYTDELLEKLSGEMRSKIGTHVVRTTDIYQNYYLKMLELNRDDEMNLEDKLEQIKQLDSLYDSHVEIIKRNLEAKTIDNDMKTIIHNLSFQHLSKQGLKLDRKRDGSQYIGSFDIRNMKSVKKEILRYKFNYMMNCLPSFTKNLTGYIENKNFMDELTKYIFSSKGEKEYLHRHTVVRESSEGINKYYMMFSLALDEGSNKVYCFYNHESKKFNMDIEPISFMIDHQLKPLKDSSLNSEIDFTSLCLEQNELGQSK